MALVVRRWALYFYCIAPKIGGGESLSVIVI